MGGESENQNIEQELSSSDMQAEKLSVMVNLILNKKVNITDSKQKEFILNFLQKLAVKSGDTTKLEEGDIDDGLFSGQDTATDKIYRLIRESSSDKNIGTKLDALNNFYKEQGGIIDDTKSKIGDLKSTTLKSKKTEEDIQKFDSTFAGKDKARIDYVESLDSKSKASLGNILKSSNLLTIYNELKIAMPQANQKGEAELTPTNNKPVTDILRKYGYEFSNFWEAPEAVAIYVTIRDYLKTQEKIPNLSTEQQLALLLDFDKNGHLETKANFNVGEAQQYHLATEGLTSDGIDAFMKNLGLESMNHFSIKMSTNLYSAREEFQRILGSYIERGVKPAELINEGGAKKSLNKLYETQEMISKQVSDTIEKSSVLQQKLDGRGISDEEMKSIKNTIKLEAVGAIVGSTNGLGASFDVKKFTNAYIDSIQVGIANGIPAVTFTKKLFDEYLRGTGLDVSASLANFFIPILGASYKKGGLKVAGGVSTIGAAGGLSYTFEGKKDVKELFKDNIKGTYEPSIYAGISTAGYAGGLSIAKVDMDRQKGIENAVDGMKDALEVIKKDLKDGKEFKDSEYSKKSNNPENDKKIYDELKQAYEMFKDERYADKVLNDMMSGYLNYYRNTLYKNASKGIKLDSLGAGIALVAGYLPIPYLSLSGEKIKQEWKGVNQGSEREREVTGKQISIKKLGGEIIDHNGKKVLSLPVKQNINYQLSDSTGKAQIERKGNTILLGGDIKLDNVKISEYTTSETATYNIVVGEGVKDKNGVYKGTQENPITSGLNISQEKTIKSSNVIAYDEKAFGSTKEIRDNINTIIQYDALDHPETKGMMKLQRMIFEYKNNGKTNLADAWDQMKKVVDHNGFMKYAIEKKAETEAKSLISKINTINSDAEKDIILQAMVMSFMKKKGLEVKGNTAEVDGKKINIAGYDVKRDKLFDSIYVSEGLSSIKGSIISAKNEWLKVNGEASNYTINQQNDGIAFTGVATSGKDKIKQLMPYTGAYNIASVEGGQDFIKINGKSNELIAQIPDSTLNIIKKQLGLGETVDNKQVRDFIKNGGNQEKGITVDYDLFFCKSGECLNDTIVLKNLRIKTPDGKEQLLGVDSSGEVYAAENSVLDLGIGVIGKREREETETNETNESGETETNETNESGETETNETNESSETETNETNETGETNETNESSATETNETNESSATETNETNETNETGETNETNETDETNETNESSSTTLPENSPEDTVTPPQEDE